MLRTILISVACVTVAWTHAGARAQQPPAPSGQTALEQARDHMEAGQAHYSAGRFVEAATEFEAAFQTQPFSAFLFNAGASYERASDAGRAIDFFSRYLEREPRATDRAQVQVRIDRLRALVAEQERLAQEAAQQNNPPPDAPPPPDGTGEGTTPTEPTAPPPEGTSTPPAPPVPEALPQDFKSLLSIRTNPEGARVTLAQEGQVVAQGPSPFAETLVEGEYRVMIEHPDFRTIETQVHVRPGKVYVVIVEMSQGEFLGYLKVVANIPGSQVFVDSLEDGAIGRTPYSNAISVGTHRVWIERPGYTRVQRDVEVAIGEEQVVRVELERVNYARVSAIANVAGARVSVDGVPIGSVPFQGDVPVGVHEVRVGADGMKDWAQNVRFEPGQLTPVRVRLRPAQDRTAAWVTLVIGGIVASGGGVAAYFADQTQATLTALRNEGRLAANDPRLVLGQALAIGADAAWGAGAALGLLSIYYFVRDDMPPSLGTVLEPRDWTLAPTASANGAGLTLLGRF